MEIIAASLSLELPYFKTIQELDVAAASLSVTNMLSRDSFISMSLELPYHKTAHELNVAAASLSVTNNPLRFSGFASMSVTASNGYAMIIDMIRGITTIIS